MRELNQYIGNEYLEAILINDDYKTQGKLNYQVIIFSYIKFYFINIVMIV